jgi:hypothetical protein
MMRGGRRASRIIGANVHGANDENIGTVDDLILRQDGGGRPVAVLSVGGFLGIGAKLVAVSLDEMRWNAERGRWTLPSATRETLESQPAWNYDAQEPNRGG